MYLPWFRIWKMRSCIWCLRSCVSCWQRSKITQRTQYFTDGGAHQRPKTYHCYFYKLYQSTIAQVLHKSCTCLHHVHIKTSSAKHHSANYNNICRAGGWGFAQTCCFLLLLLHLHLDHRSYQHLMSRHSLGGALIKGYGAPGRLGQLATFPWQVIHLWKWKWNMFFSSKSICGCEMFWQVNSPSLYCPCQMIVLIDRHHSKFSFTTVLIEFVRHCPPTSRQCILNMSNSFHQILWVNIKPFSSLKSPLNQPFQIPLRKVRSYTTSDFAMFAQDDERCLQKYDWPAQFHQFVFRGRS